MKDVQVVALIRTTIGLRGAGTSDAPYRRIVQFWTQDGELVAQVDPSAPRTMPVDEENCGWLLNEVAKRIDRAMSQFKQDSLTSDVASKTAARIAVAAIAELCAL